MNARLENMRRVCDLKGKEYASTLYANHLYWLNKTNTIYCPVWKAATTAMLDSFVELFSNSKEQKAELRRKYHHVYYQVEHLGVIHPTTRQWTSFVSSLPIPHNLTAFMIVRHPFERLVSAYRNKLEYGRRGTVHFILYIVIH